MKLKISSVAVACYLPGWGKDLSAPLYYVYNIKILLYKLAGLVTIYNYLMQVMDYSKFQ